MGNVCGNDGGGEPLRVQKAARKKHAQPRSDYKRLRKGLLHQRNAAYVPLATTYTSENEMNRTSDLQDKLSGPPCAAGNAH